LRKDLNWGKNKATSLKWCQEAAKKISDFSDKRAKSYACFTEGISSYVFRKAQYGS
jgi:hypothetical protein